MLDTNIIKRAARDGAFMRALDERERVNEIKDRMEEA